MRVFSRRSQDFPGCLTAMCNAGEVRQATNRRDESGGPITLIESGNRINGGAKSAMRQV